MNIFARLVHKIFRELFFAKVFLFYRLYGIEYVSEQLAVCPRSYVYELLRRYGVILGGKVTFKNNILIDNPDMTKGATKPYRNLQVGAGSYIGKGVYFDLYDEVVIGENCAVSAGVKFITHANPESQVLKTYYPREQKKISIGDGTWIGANAVVLQGVSIGKNCVVGAGAVVLKNIADFSVVVGVPARMVKQLKP